MVLMAHRVLLDLLVQPALWALLVRLVFRVLRAHRARRERLEQAAPPQSSARKPSSLAQTASRAGPGSTTERQNERSGRS